MLVESKMVGQRCQAANGPRVHVGHRGPSIFGTRTDHVARRALRNCR